MDLRDDIPRAANRCSEALLRILVHGGGYQRCPDRARCNGVHTDTLTNNNVVKTTSEGDNSTLGGGVIQEIRATNVGAVNS